MLPSIEPLIALPESRWHDLAERLRVAGFDGSYLANVLRVGERVDDALRAPMRIWKARRRPEHAAVVLRLFVLGDPVGEDLVREALGDVGPFVAAGLLVVDAASQVTSPFRLDVAFERLVLSDHLSAGGDAVMGPGATSGHLCRAARPHRPVDTMLDLGCGAGTVALALADRARRVVATDANPRAVAFTLLNARLNGIVNVETRVGDLFASVRGETFDLVASQPPFVARPNGADVADARFLFGGRRGDELARRIFAEVKPHLTARGRAVVIFDCPGDESVTAPPGGLDTLLVQSPARNLEDHCAMLAAAAHPTLDDAFARTAMAFRDHFESEDIASLKLTIAAIERAPAGEDGWTSVLSTRHFFDAPPESPAIDRAFEARRLLASRPPEGWLDVKLRICERASLEERVLEPGTPPACVVRLPADRLVQPFVLDAAAWRDVQAVGAAHSVRAALEVLPSEGARDAMMRHVKDALLRGLFDLHVRVSDAHGGASS